MGRDPQVLSTSSQLSFGSSDETGTEPILSSQDLNRKAYKSSQFSFGSGDETDTEPTSSSQDLDRKASQASNDETYTEVCQCVVICTKIFQNWPVLV